MGQVALSVLGNRHQTVHYRNHGIVSTIKQRPARRAAGSQTFVAIILHKVQPSSFRFIIDAVVAASFINITIVILKNDFKCAQPQCLIHIEHRFKLIRQLSQGSIVQHVARMNETGPGIILLCVLQLINLLVCCRSASLPG